MQKLKLQKNLRREILRGHPWIYQNALATAGSPTDTPGGLAQLLDPRGEHLAWVVVDPAGPIVARVLSLSKKQPNDDFFLDKLVFAESRRLHLDRSLTTCYRMVNGEGDLLPGLVIDVYGETAVIQFDGGKLFEFWTKFPLAEWITTASPNIKNIVIKHRGEQNLEVLQGAPHEDLNTNLQVLENGANFNVDILLGQKTGFFLDQRNNRSYVRQWAKDLKVLNLFSYTGGFSINAALGGAKEVTSVDVSEGSLKEARNNWDLNALGHIPHTCLAEDIYDFLPKMKQKYDMVIVDPPSMAPSEKAKPQAVKKYTEAFAEAAKKTAPQGHLVLSSCSSHISFDDFFSIITEALSLARRRGQIYRVSGQAEDHPFLHISHEMRYLKFVHLCLD